jgi:hypothetical protein
MSICIQNDPFFDLAYNLTVDVPLGENNDEYIQMVKKTLEAE